MSKNEMWGGRFAQGPSEIMKDINVSIDFDRRLYAQDIMASTAHARMLAERGIIAQEDAKAIIAGLAQVKAEIESGQFTFSRELEDIHMNVEERLKQIIGAPAGRLHTARSRNDQVATDFRLWVRDAIDRLDGGLVQFQRALVRRAGEHAATVMPGFTHLQTAQPTTFGHHLMAYVEMAARDRARLASARRTTNMNPLGSAALAGTSFPIDREMTTASLAFSEPMRNSLDGVSSRDFALEFLGACAILATHLSRLAEEIVLWTSPAFGFVRLPDAWSTGSSIMPQKRNPDAAELVRAKCARVTGSLVTLLGVMKALPLTYSKDMQEDKQAVFDAADSAELALAAMAGMVADLTVNAAAMRAMAGSAFSTATDLADFIVRVLGKPFREAHHITGRIVALAEARGCGLCELSLADMQSVEPGLTADVMSVLGVEASAGSRTSLGGTSPQRVMEQVQLWQERLK
ncbi:MAG: argininosuccinate lyase [Alphaproteobacteria bacterium]|nr:argininosuccinate lyase [Alphaproteobacteria bacterium]